MNHFIKSTIINALSKAKTDEYKSYILKQAEILNDLNVTNEKDLLKFHYISQLVPIFVKRIYGYTHKYNTTKLSSYVYDTITTVSEQEIKEKIVEAFEKNKVAYPNILVDSFEIVKLYDITKWIKALNDIYIRTRVFGNKQEAIDFITKDWENMDEVEKFKSWVKFYEQTNGGNLYKSAQFTMPLQHIPGLTPRQEEPKVEVKNISPDMHDQLLKTKSQLLGRIQSAKRILRSNKGELFAGNEYEKLLQMLLALEKDISVIKTAAGLNDIITRAKNALIYKGCSNSTIDTFVKIAQEIPAPQAPPTEPTTPEVGDSADAIEEFAENLKEELITPEEAKKEATYKWWESESQIYSLASVCSKLTNTITDLLQLASEDKINDIVKTAAIIDVENDVIEKALEGITIQDVINRLQALSKVFKNREISRQLFIIDLMLDKLGISGFFPQLAEATKSALESNQYSQNRIEEVLSKLISAVDDSGNSLIRKTPIKSQNLVEKEMEQYLNPKQVVLPEAKLPKPQTATPEITPQAKPQVPVKTEPKPVIQQTNLL